ncbi:hypothetical protein BCR37DRAFT_388590 [Protomyces lactucae-debilis]|uniref:Uncharacterized protein n=1 Tax=Protomyces lactucae-debilis TaxID=2754530 RepID=A0A1Y2F545_PROLT|nr:uncharacterized protein BCR37DRAFT_388590 [Protomyces lactucae-debilis]ORY78963.1 hypothetical protein BCR37DRAFT_388590 [Protomyces lactucae-debilis]
MPLAGDDQGRDESKLRDFFRQHFREITAWSRNHVKDLIGLPFVPPSSQQPPFTIDQQRQSSSAARSRDRFWSPQRKWKRGDPIVAIFTMPAAQSREQLHAGPMPARSQATRMLETATAAAEQELLALDPRRREVLNLPDGSTLFDLCYPGWEVAILPEDAMLHFWSRRWLFGDYYGHLLTGRTSTRMARGAGQPTSAKERENPFNGAVSAHSDLFDAAVPPHETLEQKRKRAGPLTEDQLLAAFQKSEAALQTQHQGQSEGDRRKGGLLNEEQLLAAIGKSAAARAAHRHAVFEHRRSSDLQHAAEAQQRRGVPFDAYPVRQEEEQSNPSDDLIKLEIISQQVVTQQGQTGRFSVRRTYKDGRTEVSDFSRNAAALGDTATALDEAAAQRMRREFDASFVDSSERT